MDMKTQLPCYYDDVKGWIVLSEETIAPHMLVALRNKVYAVNKGRLKDFQGDRRVRVEKALERLLKEGISVLSSKPGMSMFQATEKTSNKSMFVMGGK